MSQKARVLQIGDDGGASMATSALHFQWISPIKDLKYKPRSSCELMESAI